jgi:hypothetical protein
MKDGITNKNSTLKDLVFIINELGQSLTDRDNKLIREI